MKGILGRKAGMTTAFAEDGRAIPVTVIEVKPNTVLQVKTIETDGYIAIKLGVEDKKDNKAIKAELGIGKKANTSAKYFTKEIRNMEGFELGSTIDASIFESGQTVDVTGISKGKGFQGAIKRHNQSRGPMGHGSKSHRVTGSLGDIRSTVKKTKNMPGHMGTDQTTMQNLEVIAVDLENNALLIKGSIPGPNKSFVWVREAIKGQFKNKLEAVKLVNLAEEKIKTELLEQAHKVEAELNTTMSIEEMRAIIAKATIVYEKDEKELEDLREKADKLGITNYKKLSVEDLRASVLKSEAAEAAKQEAKAAEKPAEVKEETKVEEKAAEKVEEAKVEEKIAEVKEEPKVEEKPAEKVEEEPKVEEKPAEKVEEAKVEEKPAEKVEEPKVEEKPAEKVEEPKVEEKPAEVKEEPKVEDKNEGGKE